MIKLQNICVKFSYKEVLKNISFQFDDGKIYALLGENGAGKSTLAHIICGDMLPTDGNIFVDNSLVHFDAPRKALNHNIACVHQRPLLSDSISITENLLLGTTENKKNIIQKIPEYLNLWLPEVSPKTKVGKLSLSQKFFVSLTGVLLKNPKTIILDEPTALLDEKQKNILFQNINKLSASGITIIFITHNFDEALKYSNQVILLKNGEIAASGVSTEFTKENISEELFGGTFNNNYETQFIKNSTLIKTDNLLQLDNIEKQIINFVAKNRNQGIGFVPSDRTFRASDPNLNILQLTSTYKTHLRKSELKNSCQNLLTEAQVNIKLNEKASSLSGGMLQRIILFRELQCQPKILILCEPLQGLDYAGCNLLFKILHAQSKQNTKIIILTRTDFPEDICEHNKDISNLDTKFFFDELKRVLQDENQKIYNKTTNHHKLISRVVFEKNIKEQ